MAYKPPFKLSKFAGRDSTPSDQPAIDRIQKAFANALSNSVWASWTKWQLERRKHMKEVENENFK